MQKEIALILTVLLGVLTLIASLAPESALATTTVPGMANTPAAVQPPTDSLSRADLDTFRNALETDLDFAVRRDIRGAFHGSRCDELESLIHDALEQDPDRLVAYYLRFVCARVQGTVVEAEDARQHLAEKMAQTRRPPGEYFGDEVRELATKLDGLAYVAASDAEIVTDFFDIGGGGRRLYYVIVARDPKTGMQQRLRFDLSVFAAHAMRVIAERVSPEASIVAEDSPALLFVSSVTSLPDAHPAALTGHARFLSGVPGYSLTTPQVRNALARAVEAGGTYARLSFGQSFLVDEGNSTAAAQAYEQFNEASKAGIAEADVVLSVMYERGIGTTKDVTAANQAMRRAVSAFGRTRTDNLLAQVLLVEGSMLHDEARGHAKLEEAAREGDAMAQNSLGIWCESHSHARMETCVDLYTKSSSQGFAIATRNLALVHDLGKGVPKDFKKAEALYKEAIAAGYLTAATDLGWMMERSPSAKDEAPRIAELYRIAAEWGDAWGQNNFANNLRDGIGIAKDPARAVRWLDLAAAQGNAAATYSLGLAYESGIGIAPDQAQAANLFRYAGNLGNTPAMVRLAIMTGEGRGVEKNPEVSRQLFLRAAELDNSEAMRQLGIMYVYGSNGIAADRAAGIDWLRKSALKDNQQGAVGLGIVLLQSDSEQDRTEGIQWLRKMALAGNEDGMTALGVAYENGRGVTRDYDEAAKWYRKSSAAGNASGTNNLAHLKVEGLGETKDAVQGRALFEQASAQGALEATCNLAAMLLDGEGGPKDAERGRLLMHQAADAGNGPCQLKLGVDYRYGIDGVTAEMGKAKAYLKLAQDQRIDEASAQLAEITMVEHEDVDEQIRSSFAELSRLADAGGARAQFLLAEACIVGRPWPRDPVCARRRFQQAADRGFVAAASNLGMLLESNLGGPADLDAAELWFRKAIRMGATRNQYELGRLLLRKGRSAEGIQNLLAVGSYGALPAYVLMRYCNEHPDCGVSRAQRAVFAKTLKKIPEADKNEIAWGLAVDPMSDAEDGRYAVSLMKSLSREPGTDWSKIDTLAASYARAGDFEQAVATQKRAIALAPANVMRRTRNALKERLSSYQSRETCDYPY